MKFFPISCFFSFYLHIKFGTVDPQSFIKLLWVGAVKAVFCLGSWTNVYVFLPLLVSILVENRYKGSGHSCVYCKFRRKAEVQRKALRESRGFVIGVNSITLKRVQWNLMAFWKQRMGWLCVCTASPDTPFTILSCIKFIPCTQTVISIYLCSNSRLSVKIEFCLYEGWNFNSGNYLFTTDTK